MRAEGVGRRRSDPRLSARLASPLVLLLSLLSAVALLALGISLRAAPLVVDPSIANAADAEVVARFYAGLNQVLADGDAAQLDAVLASDVVVHLPGQPAGDRATLLAWLAAMRDAAPGARITLSDVLVGGERAAARATATGGAPMLAGVAVLGAPASWDASAFLQLRDRRVVGYRPVAAPAALSSALPEWRLPLVETPQLLLLARLRLPTRRSEARLATPRWRLLLAESGVAAVNAAGSVQRSILGPAGGQWQEAPPTERPIMLRPGETLLIPPDAPLAMRPADDGPVVLLLLGGVSDGRNPTQRWWPGQRAGGPGVGSELRGAGGAALEPLAEGLLPAGGWAGGEAVVRVTRATLPPGAALAPHAVASGQLLAVEAGLLGVAVPAIGEAGADPAGEVLIRNGFSLARGMAPRLRNAGGTRLDLLVVTLEPPASSGAAIVASPVVATTAAGRPRSASPSAMGRRL